jgi:gluconate 2-dehydrogenase gamma chain
MTMSEQKSNSEPNQARRNFLKQSGIALGGVVVGGVIGGALAGSKPKAAEPKPTEVPKAEPTPVVTEKVVEKVVDKPVYYNQALMFFNQQQYQITDAAAERIFPKDDLGPGAQELGVAFFIDHQLASSWGVNGKDYTMGPFLKGEPTQGPQTHLKRAQIFTIGLQALQDYSQEKYKKGFAEISAAEQDETLKVFEKGADVKLEAISTSTFFGMLRSLTMEGLYSDPMYGGNKDMLGWKMKKYPGNQPSYFNDMEKDGFIVMEPKSLHDHMNH